MPSSAPAPILVFDLDGTLVDSVPDILAAVNRMAATQDMAPLDRLTVTPMIGDGVRVLIERVFAARNRVFSEAAFTHFAADYAAHATEETRLFPGAKAALAALRAGGWKMAVCTNKPVAPARALLAALAVEGFFDAIGGGDSFPVRKPDPAHLRATIEQAGGDTRRAVMIGDHRNDVLAATGLGMPCIWAGWGYGVPAMAEGTAATASTYQELPELARRLVES